MAVHLRGRMMRAACSGRRLGNGRAHRPADPRRQQLVERDRHREDPLWVANVNSATQTVLGGTAAAECRRTTRRGPPEPPRSKGSTSRWPLTGPCRPKPRALAAHLAALPLRTPTARYVTNTGGRAVDTAEAILDDLAQSVAQPVRWYDGVRLMAELGVTCSIETHPATR